MEINLNDVAGLVFWGPVAVIAWGAALAAGRWLASVDVRDAAPARTPDRRSASLDRFPRTAG